MIGQVYILLGMGIIAMCVNLMQEKIITEVRNKETRIIFELIILIYVRFDFW